MQPLQSLAPLVALMVCLVADCPGGGSAAMPTSPSSLPLAHGVWGGEGVVMQVSTDGAELEFTCAHGAIEAVLEVDAGGRFDLPGSYVAERGGPAPDEGAAPRRARYRGQVRGDELRLTVTLVEAGDVVGTFTLVRGRSVRLVKCQ